MRRIAFVCGVIVASSASAAADATLRTADVTIVFSPGRCDVSSRFVIDAADPSVVEHRVIVGTGAPPQFVVLGGIAGHVEIVGPTARVPISLIGSGRNEYSVRYHVPLTDTVRDRCSLLVPTASTDGANRGVRIAVELPDGATLLPGAFPAFSWADRRGSVAIGHMPSFVRVPHAARGTPIAWRDTVDVARAIDLAALGTLAMATLAWVAFRRRRS